MEEMIVGTRRGRVRGVVEAGVVRFLGVPYAAPPVGALRFAVPQPHAAWDDIRDASVPGANAPQSAAKVFPGLDISILIGKGWQPGEDFLTLNIWRPAGEVRGAPVMLFVHGGAFVVGSKDAAVNDGGAFARDGVILVAINYRLGVEGFLPIPGVPTNLGLRDQLAAIRWVRDNIAAFGGDADNITVFGESAGAMSVANLVASPLAEGLLRRAIVQSGHGAMTRSIPLARKVVAKLAKIAGITPDEAGFRSRRPGDLIGAVERINQPTTRIDLRDAHGREPVFGISRLIPVHGDDVLPLPPLEALAQGQGADIDLLIGTNAEEMNFYFVPTGLRDRLGRLLATFALHRVQPHANRVLKTYGIGRGVKPGRAFTAAATDIVFRWPTRRFAEEHRGRTHMYEFDWPSPRFGGLGAAHGMELPFVFDTLACATGEDVLVGEHPPQELATRIHRLWIDFARDGSLPWRPFTRDDRQVFQLATGAAIDEAPLPIAPFLP
ncbi:carboxylesterase family protein [Sphingomonas naphthae]|uniref:Carboxylic ester hydrolase n=1 Tax=Sphingomonas naphthae TaxID=1813468 RepID=A0ABY7TK84_9SPHN|nr:carboxylesterase family protein [Sphingomonas naphthae]WCT72805.1 carboxylesterase family protein [Sphingomonas naphthae]